MSKTDLALHTDMPMRTLTELLAGNATPTRGQAAGGVPDCFYGWGEAQNHEQGDCISHAVVTNGEPFYLDILAQTLIRLGYQVVVTDRNDWSIQYDDQFPLHYDDHHQH